MAEEMPELVRAVAVTPEELPSLALDLPEGKPREVHRVVGLLVVAGALFRKSWPDEIDMSIARARAMRRDEPKAGETLATGDAILVDTINARRCMLCGGSGFPGGMEPDGAMTIDAQGNPRFAMVPRRCADCDGTGELVTAKVRMVSDQQTSLHDVILPTELHRIQGLMSLERIVEGIVPATPNEAFRCHDLRKVAEVSAYRGTQRQQDPTFFGWSFRDTIDLGAKAVDAFLSGKGKVLVADIRAYAWPLLWLRYDRPEKEPIDVVILRDEQGSARRIRSDEGEKPGAAPV